MMRGVLRLLSILLVVACSGASDTAALVPPPPPPAAVPGTISLSLSAAPAATQAMRLRVVARGLSQLAAAGTTRVIAQRLSTDTADIVLLLPALGENLFTFKVADRDAPFTALVVEASAGRSLDYVSVNPATVQLGIRRQ